MTRNILLILCATAVVHAQDFNEWYDARVLQIVEKQRVGANGQGGDRQRESPSADTRSTSLVDQSSATDFFSVAVNLVPVTPALSGLLPAGSGTPSNGSGAGSGTVTSTVYALLAALNKVSPTNPAFYRDHTNARRLSFTIGTADSTPATDNTDKPATVVGGKFLILNGRDLYTKTNLAKIAVVQKLLSQATVAGAHMKDRIQGMMFEALHPGSVKADGTYDTAAFQKFVLSAFSAAAFPGTLKALPQATLDRIDQYIQTTSGPYVTLRSELEKTYDEIRKGRQLSVSYTANVRKELGNNTHRAGLNFDYGLSDRIMWTFNASADYTDRKASFDSRGGRMAMDFQGDLTKPDAGWGRLPIRLSFSGEAKWLTKQKPQYTFQSKLTIPVSAGVDLPIVYRYANRIELIDQTNPEARLGLSVDIARLASLFQ